jgi:hypothetical protein
MRETNQLSKFLIAKKWKLIQEDPLKFNREQSSWNGIIKQTLIIEGEKIALQEFALTRSVWPNMAKKIVKYFLKDELATERAKIEIVDNLENEHFKIGRFRNVFVKMTLNYSESFDSTENFKISIVSWINQIESHGSQRLKQSYRRIQGQSSG